MRKFSKNSPIFLKKGAFSVDYSKIGSLGVGFEKNNGVFPEAHDACHYMGVPPGEKQKWLCVSKENHNDEKWAVRAGLRLHYADETCLL